VLVVENNVEVNCGLQAHRCSERSPTSWNLFIKKLTPRASCFHHLGHLIVASELHFRLRVRLSRKGVHALISSLTFRLAYYAPVRL
jgi:hypothetical protein